MKQIISFIVILSMLFSMVLMVQADVTSPSNWAEQAIDEIKKSNVLEPGFFTDYKSNITRKDFAYLIYVLYESFTGNEFSTIVDVKSNISFTDTIDEYIIAAAKAGIIGGYGNGKVGPEDLISREQMAVMFVKMLQKANITLDLEAAKKISFADNKEISAWAVDSAKIAFKYNIITGIGDNQIGPKGYATRETALVMFYRIMNNAQLKPDAAVTVTPTVSSTAAAVKPTEVYKDTDGTVFMTDSEYFDMTYISKRTSSGGYELVGDGMTETYRFILQNDIFYFAGLNFDGFFVLHSMNKDGSGKTKLSDKPLSAFTVSPNKIYISTFGNPGIYEMNLDGTGVKKISEDVASTLVYYDNKLYYNIYQLDEPAYMKAVFVGALKVLDLKTLEPSLLVPGKIAKLDVYNDYVYYSSFDDDFVLYRIRIGDTSPERLNIKAFDFAFKDNLIYFSDVEHLVPWGYTFKSKLPSLSTANLDGTNVMQLTNYPASDVYVSGDFIRYHEYCDGGFGSYEVRHTINIKTLPDIRSFE